MLQSITHSLSLEQPHFEAHLIVLWHVLIGTQWRPIPGVVVSADDEQQLATIKVRTLDGQIRMEVVAYDEIEVRS